jgi:DNA-binding NtrC family response regulator
LVFPKRHTGLFNHGRENKMSEANIDEKEKYILIVDDDNTLLKFFKIHLNKFFSKIIVAKNATEALDVVKTKEIDLIISDFKMPRVDGVQFMKKAKKHDASIPFLFISGALLTENQQAAIDKSSDGYLKKPFSIDELHDFITNGLSKRDKLITLSELVPDKTKLKDFITGKTSLKRIKDEQQREEAKEIIDDLSKSA